MLFIGNKTSESRRHELDSSDLRTHGVCVGMTGSGKTGFCVGLIEELRLSKIPSIIIDPKGDMTNLMLAFPDLAPGDFLPWINPEDARRENLSPEQFAEKISSQWKTGLAGDGIDSATITRMVDSTPATVFTPGSTAGQPLNVLTGLEAPDTEDPEQRAELAKTAVTALLALIGVSSDPLTGREFILLSNILHYCWDNNEPASLERIIAYVQNPPMKRLGIFAVDKFYPARNRTDFALKLNGLAASPSFGTWMVGTPLDIDQLTFLPDGRPRCSIVYLAHLSDQERQFTISLLLARILAWARQQSGTDELRMLVYIDEVAGMLPPFPKNPPTKPPILTLFKQARAFGIGMFVVTQNPMDLDYKAMSNAGFWAIGRLSTDNDRRRIVEGLKGVAGVPPDLSGVLAGLEKRRFLIRNVHEESTEVIKSRFAMSYLRGPMTKEDIKTLRGDKPPVEVPQPAEKPQGLVLPPEIAGIRQYFLAPEALREPEMASLFRAGFQGAAGERLYHPALYTSCQVRYDDTKAKLLYDETVSRVVFPLDDPSTLYSFSDDTTPLPDLQPFLSANPMPEAGFMPLPTFLDDPSEFEAAARSLADYCFRSRNLPLYMNRELKAYSRPGESQEEFIERIKDMADEQAKEKLEKEQTRQVRKMERLEEKRRKIEQRLSDAQADAKARDSETMVSVLESAAGFLFGRRRSIGRAVSTSMRKSRMAKRSKRKLDNYEEDLIELEEQIEELEDAIAKNEADVFDEYDRIAQEIEEYPVPAERNDIRTLETAIIWVPLF